MSRTRSGAAPDEPSAAEPSAPQAVDDDTVHDQDTATEVAGLLAAAELADDTDGVVLDRSHVWPAPDISTQMERPTFAERQCSRSGCSDAAGVTLSYHYGQSQVWIDRLSPEREPHMYDMCDGHAERMSVPQGWHLDDRRGARRGSLIAV